MYMSIDEYPTPKDETYASVYTHEDGREQEWVGNFADARTAAEWLEANGFSKAFPEQEGDWSDPVNRMMMDEYCVAVYEKETDMNETTSRDGYEGPGFYQVMWSDGGECGYPQWIENQTEYDEMLECAGRYETETHLAYAELVGRDVFQEYELEAFLDSPADYDMEGIIEDATFIDYATGDRIWRVDIDLNGICEENIRR